MAKILIVDDSKIMRENIKNILVSLGHNIIGEAVDGFDAIEKYKALHPEIVTMDITMPLTNGIEDGIEALSDIIKYDQKAKVIMITSHGEQDKIIDAIQSGASNYIMKPLNLENTQEIILKTLSKSQTTLGRKFKRL